MPTETITMKLRGRPVTSDEAAASVQRLINSRFNQSPGARVQIPVAPDDDDVTASDYVIQSREQIADLETTLKVRELIRDEARVVIWRLYRALEIIDGIASGSSTVNSLQNIAKIAKDAIAPDQPAPKHPLSEICEELCRGVRKRNWPAQDGLTEG